jgi:endonuclease YncB( thermonuclease family)
MGFGLLEVAGVIDITQFWPSGQSDADTTKVIVDVSGDAIRFRRNDSSPFQPTHVFDDAIVKGRARKAPIRNGKMTIRLQGIDAPELHYQPAPLSKSEKEDLSDSKIEKFKSLAHFYRQFLGATSTYVLHEFLNESGAASLSCRVFTQVDKPNEVFDTYGRFVGDIEIAKGADSVNLNHWLTENGWVFPAFYSSMTDREIETLKGLSALAREEKRGVWKYLLKTIEPFDFDLREPERNDTSILADDSGPVLFPKLYRRYTSWSARHKAKTTSESFQEYLAADSNGKPDVCYEANDFLANGVHSATPRRFDEFVQAGKKVKFAPDELVFGEAPSTLLASDGSKIQTF